MNNGPIGTHLGPYKIQAKIGCGRISTVYEAYDPINDRPVVIKVLTVSLADDEALRRRFEQHAQALTRLDHPNILKVYDYGVDPSSGLAYLVTPFIGGGTLDERLGRLWPIEDAVRIAAEVARALDYAHRQGIVHGDVRPNNILLTEGGWALLTDFGLAALLEVRPDADVFPYWTPERLQGNPAGPAADLYALGVILYEMLTGHLPFQADTAEAMCQQQLAGPSSLNRVRTDVPPSLEKVLLKALASDEQQRYGSAVDLARALEGSLPSDIFSPRQSARPITPPAGVRVAVPPRRSPIAQEGATTVRSAEATSVPVVAPRLRQRIGRFLWRATKWVLSKIAAALFVLILVAAVLLIGGAFALSALMEQMLVAQEWDWTGWEQGGVSVIWEADLREPLRDAVKPYALGALTDLGADFRPPNVVEVRGYLRRRPLRLQARLEARDGVLYIRLERLDGVPLYVIGGIISDGINRGLRSSWEGAPVRLTTLEVQDDRIQAVLEPRPGPVTTPVSHSTLVPSPVPSQ